jgi:hypothetical protein
VPVWRMRPAFVSLATRHFRAGISSTQPLRQQDAGCSRVGLQVGAAQFLGRFLGWEKEPRLSAECRR